MHNNTLNEQQLEQLYRDLGTEHASLLNTLRTEEIGTKREKTMNRILSVLNSLTINVRKLQQLKKALTEM
jgi:hypothetical protein